MDAFEGWGDFNAALGTASAALAGLIMVAISVNIKQVLSYPGISARAAASLALLVLVLITSLNALIPGQSLAAAGWTALTGCALVWLFALNALRTLVRVAGTGARISNAPTRGPRTGWIIGNAVLFVGPLGALTAGGVLLVLGQNSGTSWIATGSLGALAAAVVFSWIALVEILR